MKYKIYGLIIESEIELPEASGAQLDDKTDVIIKLGEMPDFIIEKRKSGYNSGILMLDYSWFYIEDVAEFFVEKGEKIIIKMEPDANVNNVKAMLLGAALGDIMVQKGLIALHGGAVVLGNKAILISGISGAGKSSLVTELLKDDRVGFLTDDTLRVSIGDEIIAYPAFPQQKICKDLAIKFGYDVKQLELLYEEREKYALPRKKEFCENEILLDSIILISEHQEDAVVMEEVNGTDKLQVILKNLYPAFTYERLGIHPEVFKKSVNIASKVKVYHLKRPKGKYTMGDQAALIKERYFDSLRQGMNYEKD